MKRETAASAVKLAFNAAALCLAWQAVRFCLGDIGNVMVPFFDFIRYLSGVESTPEPTGFIGAIAGGTTTLVQGLFGFVAWLMMAAWVVAFGGHAERIVSVGWHQYRAEEREASEAARVAQERQAAKDRRRELRRKVLEAREPRRGSSGFFPFLLGLLIGSLFL
ncbi:TPA: hypothetical protein OXB44_005377 [Escherichia coli]|nr:hypothetical protein [Escherichia coli]HCW2870800.1 hypothetical protein [Escherichia coli]